MSAPARQHAVAQRDLGLDLLRVVAAAMVFVFHLSQTGHVRNLGLMGEAGNSGVTIFFVLSGFLL